MSIEIKLPNLGDGIVTGDVLSVLVKEGDSVARDQGIVELETGKATIEVPSTHAGKVVKVHVAPGQTIPIGAVLISVEGSASAAPATPPRVPVAPAKLPPKPAEPPKPAPTAVSPPAPAPSVGSPSAVESPAPVAASAPPQVPASASTPARSAHAPVVATPSTGQASSVLIAASPTVRRFAREVGIDLAHVRGSGESGRVTRDDVLAVVRQTNQAVRTAAPAPAATPPVDNRQSDAWGFVRIERMPKIRQTIAAKMHESWTTVARVTNFDDADVTELEKFRQASKDDYAAQGIKLTSLPFVVKSVAMALRGHPVINASIDMEHGQIIYKDYVNIGVAVDSDRGLVVPSLRSADRMSIPEIARGIASLAERVRTNSFQLDDLRGSTFTISNLGAIGGTYSTPIVNTPEVAILLVGRARKIPVVIDDQVAIRLMMPLSLSYDHRLVDGAAAARFLNDIMGYLKAPSRLLMAL